MNLQWTDERANQLKFSTELLHEASQINYSSGVIKRLSRLVELAVVAYFCLADAVRMMCACLAIPFWFAVSLPSASAATIALQASISKVTSKP